MEARNDLQKTRAEKLDKRPVVAPPVDVFENADEVLLVADLPGVERDALSIHFEKNHLTFEGRRGAGDGAFDYRRTFVVPSGIDAEKISAELALGVLRVKLPKSAALKPRQIPIKSA